MTIIMSTSIVDEYIRMKSIGLSVVIVWYGSPKYTSIAAMVGMVAVATNRRIRVMAVVCFALFLLLVIFVVISILPTSNMSMDHVFAMMSAILSSSMPSANIAVRSITT